MRDEEKVEHERKLVRVEAEMSEVFNRKVSPRSFYNSTYCLCVNLCGQSSHFIFAQVEQKVERLRQTEASLEKRIERERTEVLNTF